MFQSLGRPRWLASTLVLLAAFCIPHLACARDPGQRSVPFAEPVNLAQEGVLATLDFRVKKHEIYNFGIRFRYPENDQAERSRIRSIIGGHELDRNGQAREPGVVTPVRITISRKRAPSDVVYRKELTPVLTAWGMDSFARGSEAFTKALGHCDLVPGDYTVVFESLAHPAEYASIPSYFFIAGNSFKTTFDRHHVDRSRTCPQ